MKSVSMQNLIINTGNMYYGQKTTVTANVIKMNTKLCSAWKTNEQNERPYRPWVYNTVPYLSLSKVYSTQPNCLNIEGRCSNALIVCLYTVSLTFLVLCASQPGGHQSEYFT